MGRGDWKSQNRGMTLTASLIRLYIVLLLASGLVMIHDVGAAPPEDDGTSIRIIFPADGAVIAGNDVDLEYKFLKGELADHVLFYLDGQHIPGPFQAIMGLSSGSHQIKLVAATADHRLLKATATARFQIK